jgi:membrane protein implicated in regulation of membrane protease activity
MHWLFLILAVAALALAFVTTSVGVALLSLVAATVLSVVWLLQFLSARVRGAGRDEVQLLSPDELRRLAERGRESPGDRPD